jgi:hypothetical protein
LAWSFSANKRNRVYRFFFTGALVALLIIAEVGCITTAEVGYIQPPMSVFDAVSAAVAVVDDVDAPPVLLT